MEMLQLHELLTSEERQQIRAPIAEAKTLPRRAFFDQDFYHYERAHVLQESWLAVSFSASIPLPGDLINLTITELPVLLVRGHDARVRAFHNVCPYDSCEVSYRAQRGVDTIITPYHGWEYSLEGKLLNANFWNGKPDPGSDVVARLDADLIEIPCHEWLETVFIFPGENVIPFELANSAVIDHLEEINLEGLKTGMDASDKSMLNSLDIRANWKTVYENYSPNVYHESFVHQMYRDSPYSPRVNIKGQKTYTEINDPSGFLGLCYENSMGASFYGESPLPAIKNKDGTANAINTIANVFPNWVVTMLGNAARVSIFLPDGPESGSQQVATLFYDKGATAPQFTEDRVRSVNLGLQARREDNIICESIQRARHSPAVEQQFYSPFWDAMHYTLSNLILDRLEAAESS